MDLQRVTNPPCWERLSTLLLREPEDREQLVKLAVLRLRKKPADADALSMNGGLMQVSERQVREIHDTARARWT